jgi:hypothetical protein
LTLSNITKNWPMPLTANGSFKSGGKRIWSDVLRMQHGGINAIE